MNQLSEHKKLLTKSNPREAVSDEVGEVMLPNNQVLGENVQTL